MANFSHTPGGNQIRDIHGHFAGGFAINWIGLEAFAKDVREISKDLDIRGQADKLAKDIQTYAKDNAPWQDQSGDARDLLLAEVQQTRSDEYAIILSHGVEYGLYLENRNGGEFAIIVPTMQRFASELGTRMFGPGIKR